MRLVRLPALKAHIGCARIDADDVSPIEKLSAEFQRASAIVLLEQIRVDEPVGGREGRAGNPVELVDFRHATMYVGGRQRLNLMAEFALERDMLDGARECVFVVEPEVALLAEADLVAHALVIFDRRAA